MYVSNMLKAACEVTVHSTFCGRLHDFFTIIVVFCTPVLLASGSIDDKVEAILEPVEDETVQVQVWTVLAKVHQDHKHRYKFRYKKKQ